MKHYLDNFHQSGIALYLLYVRCVSVWSCHLTIVQYFALDLFFFVSFCNTCKHIYTYMHLYIIICTYCYIYIYNIHNYIYTRAYVYICTYIMCVQQFHLFWQTLFPTPFSTSTPCPSCTQLRHSFALLSSLYTTYESPLFQRTRGS